MPKPLSRKRFAGLLLLLAAISGFPAAAQTTLRYTDHEPLGNMRTTLLRNFFDELEKQSHGRLKVDDHWGSKISSGYDALKTVGEGAKADIGMIVPEYSDKTLPLHQVFKGFLTGPSGANQVRLLRTIYEQVPELDEELKRNNVVPVLIATGYPVGFFSSRPMNGLESIKGQRWRTASFWHRNFLNQYGAVPVTMPWSPDVATALGDGRLDGLMVNIDSAVDLDVPKNAPNILFSQRLWLGHVYIVAMNRKKWENLPAQDKDAIRSAAESTYRVMGATMDRSFADMARILAEKGRHVRLLTSVEVDDFAHVSNTVEIQDDWARRQEAQRVHGAQSVLASIRRLWRAAMQDQP